MPKNNEVAVIPGDSPRPLEASDKLLRIFEDVHNHIYANDGLSSQQVFEEILDILFIKIFDEKNNKDKQFFVSDDEYEKITSGEPRRSFTDRIQNLKKQSFSYFSDILDGNEEIHLKTSSLSYVVNKLQKIDLSSSSRDVKGLAFQKFVYSKQRADRGQFFTPEQVVSLCVEILKPQKDDLIIDPACGSAGFLSQAMKYVYDHSLRDSSDKERQKFTENNIFGIEINPTVAKLAKMRMILDGDGFSNIIVSDSLADFDSLNTAAARTNKNIKLENKFSLILTNPPFGTQGKILNKNMLAEFDLGHKWENSSGNYRKTDELLVGQVPDILFIERCLSLLRVGGRMAIVLPNGDLENSSMEYVRKYISSKAKILAVVALPFDTFIPFGTGVKASVLFLEKGAGTNKNIFFGKINKIGYKGNKNGLPIYKKTKSGQLIFEGGLPLVDEDVSEVSRAYKKFLQGSLIDSDSSFSLSAGEPVSRLDTSFHLPSNRLLEKKLSGRKECRPLGELVKIVKRKFSAEEDGVVKYVELSDVIPRYSEIASASEMYAHELPSRASYLLKEGDIITAVAGNSIGTENHASAMVTKEFENTICTNGFRILQAREGLNPYYLLFFLRHPHFLQQIFRYRTGAAIPSISDEDLLKILVYCPPMAIQQEIATKVMDSFEVRKNSKEVWAGMRLEI